MNDTMNAVLSRILSEEIAKQEVWRDLEQTQFEISPDSRNEVIDTVKAFMQENNIDFRQDFYCEQKCKMM